MSEYEYIGRNKSRSPIQTVLGKSNFSMLSNGTTRKQLQQVILEFLEECQWDEDIIKRELPNL